MEHPLDDSGHQQCYPVVDKVLCQPHQHHPPGYRTVPLVEQLPHGNQLPTFGNILIHQYLYLPHTYQGFSILLAHLVDQGVHCFQLLLLPQVVQGLPAPETVKNQRKNAGDAQDQQHQSPLVVHQNEVSQQATHEIAANPDYPHFGQEGASILGR